MCFDFLGRITMKNIDMSRAELINLIDEYIIGNNAIRDREIMKDRLIDGYSYYQLSEKYNLSLPSIKQILSKRNQQLFKHLG